MERRFHWSLAPGFVLALAGMLTFPFFAQYPATRDFAWVNLLLLSVGVVLLITSLTRAFRQPQLFRGKILGGILTTASVLALAFFAVGIFYLGRVPQPEAMQKAGEKAPEFSLPDQSGNNVSLRDLLASSSTSQGSPAKGALLIFYRGYW
jgi:lysylphosphatidylglycerol synthetase-like protein (DUF2156 family)